MKKYVLIPFLFVLFSCSTSTKAEIVLPQPVTEQEEYLFQFVEPYERENDFHWTKKINSDWAEFIFLNKINWWFSADQLVDFNSYSVDDLRYFENLLNDYQNEIINPIADCLNINIYGSYLNDEYLPKACPFFYYNLLEEENDYYPEDYRSRHEKEYQIYTATNQSTLDWYLDHSKWVCSNLTNNSLDIQSFVNRLFFDSFVLNEELYKDTSNIQWMVAKSAIHHMCPENKTKFYSAITTLPQN
jgi:hypothetical protein